MEPRPRWQRVHPEGNEWAHLNRDNCDGRDRTLPVALSAENVLDRGFNGDGDIWPNDDVGANEIRQGWLLEVGG